MTFKSFASGLCGAALLALMPTASDAAEQHQLSLRNDVGHAVVCGIRHAGSSAIDSFTLRAGQTWNQSYAGSKARLLLCEGSASSWQSLGPDQAYRLVKAAEERIVAQPDSAH